jgi:hypothetical protein
VVPAAVVEEEEVVAAGEVDGLLDAVVRITAVVISRPVGVEFAILAGAGGGVDFDLLEFNEGAGKGRPAVIPEKVSQSSEPREGALKLPFLRRSWLSSAG